MIIMDNDGKAVLDRIDEDVDLQVGLNSLDILHENWLVEQAQIEQSLADLLGSKYAQFKVLQEKRAMLDKNYSDRKEQLRKEILAPAIISRHASARSKFFRVEYSQGSELVNREALREWADTMGLRERVENFIKRAAPFIKITLLKGES